MWTAGSAQCLDGSDLMPSITPCPSPAFAKCTMVAGRGKLLRDALTKEGVQGKGRRLGPAHFATRTFFFSFSWAIPLIDRIPGLSI